MIVVKNVSHSFEVGKRGQKHKIHVLDDVSLSVHNGEIVTVVGRSGSGKSTLLNIISGFLKPTQGEMWIAGKMSAFFNNPCQSIPASALK